eukprot:Gb_14184 [translate_table: standard]
MQPMHRWAKKVRPNNRLGNRCPAMTIFVQFLSCDIIITNPQLAACPDSCSQDLKSASFNTNTGVQKVKLL